ncbi:MAG: SH3 domain-containing protein [Lachnospiraceae bacterium]|nr:SH3 domain-containing protein [Lachnospiraceae bacterium]
MKKRTINIILMSIIGLLIVAICVLIVQILNRPRYTASTEPQTTVITEIPHSEAVSNMQESQPVKPEVNELEQSSISRGKTSTKVNIRELPSEDARVLETVEAGTEFDIIEILDSGWTMIQYQEDMEAYISSSYVIPIP